MIDKREVQQPFSTNTRVKYDIKGITCLDYLAIFKKTTL